MQLLQPRSRNVGVDLSGRQVAVTNNICDGAQIRAMVEQVRERKRGAYR